VAQAFRDCEEITFNAETAEAAVAFFTRHACENGVQSYGSMNAASDSVFAPKPCPRVRLYEHVDFTWRQRKSPQMKICEGLDGIEDKPDAKVLVSQQPVNDLSDHLMGHTTPAFLATFAQL